VTITTDKATWARLLALPIAENDHTQPENTPTTTPLEGVWKGFGSVFRFIPLCQHVAVAKLRSALGMSQPEFGALIALYAHRAQPYNGATVAMWEWWERSGDRSNRWQYAATKEVMRACAQISEDAIIQVSKGTMKAKKVRGAWQLRAICVTCSREFKPRNGKHKRCARCGGKAVRA